MITLAAVAAIAGWAALAGVVLRLRRVRRGLIQAREDAEARIAGAEASRHWLRAALDESTDAIVVVDRIGREIFRNETARRFATSRTGEVLVDDALDELVQSAMRGLIPERELEVFGPPRHVLHLRAFPLHREGELVGAVGFARDVSESRHIDKVRRDFVANVSHELKTPIGALALLAETMATTDDAEVMHELADRVVREAERLSRIVEDLLDLSTIEAQEAPERTAVALPALVSECIELVQASAARAAVDVRLAPPPPEISIVVDARQLRSALINLLDNAIKYSAPGDTVEVGASVERGQIAIVVRDHGIGIPTRDLERIFERFYRVDRARSRDTGGTGLGLSIVRHVARAHGGDVTVQSREGQGATFTLSIPTSSSGSLSEAS